MASKVAPAEIDVEVFAESEFVMASVPAVTLTLAKPTPPESVEVPALSLMRLPVPPI